MKNKLFLLAIIVAMLVSGLIFSSCEEKCKGSCMNASYDSEGKLIPLAGDSYCSMSSCAAANAPATSTPNNSIACNCN